MAPVDNTEHLVANALRNANLMLVHTLVSRPHGTLNKHHGLGPNPKKANNIAVDAAREALEQANEEDAFVAYYPNRHNPPTNGLFLLRIIGYGSSQVTGGRMTTVSSTSWICEAYQQALMYFFYYLIKSVIFGNLIFYCNKEG